MEINRRNLLGSLAAGGVATLAAGSVAAAVVRSDVKITRIRIMNPPNFKSLAGIIGLTETVVAVDTDAGITGYGQGGTPDMLCYSGGNLINEDPMRTEYLWQRMYRSSIYPAGRERIHAVGALDCALWDIKGKLLDAPVYDLIGGRTRDHLECYKSTVMQNVKTAGEEGRKSMDEGFRAIRFFMTDGSAMFDGRRAINPVVAICAALREGMGPEGEFIYDAHTRFNLPDIVQLCERVKDYHPLFIEDPLHTMDDYEAFAMLRRQTSVPLAAGEQFGDLRDGNLTLVQRNLIDFLRTSIPNMGGITAFRKLSALCEAHGVTMTPHFTSPIATAAVVHGLFTYPGQALFEVFNPALPQYLKEAYIFRDGKMYHSDRPGLGVVVDESRLNPVATITERTPELYHGNTSRQDGSHLYL